MERASGTDRGGRSRARSKAFLAEDCNHPPSSSAWDGRGIPAWVPIVGWGGKGRSVGSDRVLLGITRRIFFPVEDGGSPFSICLKSFPFPIPSSLTPHTLRLPTSRVSDAPNPTGPPPASGDSHPPSLLPPLRGVSIPCVWAWEEAGCDG